jgi:hypothetical protein
MARHPHILPVILGVLLMQAVASAATPDTSGASYIHRWNSAITEVMIEDGFSPAAQARFFSYLHIAAYEAARHGAPEYRSFAGLVRDLTPVPAPDTGCVYDWRVAAIAAYKKVASLTLFRIYITDSLYEVSLAELEATGLSPEVRACSERYGVRVGEHVLAWMKPDGYVKIQASGKYVIPKYTGAWEPTPPDFKEPADPFWGPTLRPLTLDSARQFPPIAATAYDEAEDSRFYEQAREVYDLTRSLSDEQKAIAMFWNDTPIRTHHYGHLMYASRQISPSGHWMSIAQSAAVAADADMMRSLAVYSSTAVAIYDALISCWSEKFRSNVMRPVTYINRYIDSTWEPMIQTPPFPEHTSGHSSISGAASTVLTHWFGTRAFVDSTEERFGWGVRSFESFEAAASRGGGEPAVRRNPLRPRQCRGTGERPEDRRLGHAPAGAPGGAENGGRGVDRGSFHVLFIDAR